MEDIGYRKNWKELVEHPIFRLMRYKFTKIENCCAEMEMERKLASDFFQVKSLLFQGFYNAKTIREINVDVEI